MRTRHALAVALAGALTLGLAACSSGQSDVGTPSSDAPGADVGSADAGSGSAAGADTFPVVIEHALGTTTIPEKPERVATIAWGNQDVPLALGVVPVGTDTQVWNWTGTANLGLYEWSTDAIAELGGEDPVIFSNSDGIDFEAISDTNPDVILAALSGLTQEDYDTLSQIAPVVAYPEIPWYTLWRQQIQMNSEALGLSAEGDALVADLEDQIAAATASASSIEGKSAIFVFADAADLSTISIYTAGDSRTAFLTDLGFTTPQAAIDAEATGSFYLDIAAENADQLTDADVIVAYGGDELLPALQAHPLWGTLPAVQAGSVVAVGDGDTFSSSVSPTALSIPWMLKDYVARLDAAAAKAP